MARCSRWLPVTRLNAHGRLHPLATQIEGLKGLDFPVDTRALTTALRRNSRPQVPESDRIVALPNKRDWRRRGESRLQLFLMSADCGDDDAFRGGSF